MGSPFRFIQSGNFHLERPPRWLAEIPDSLRAALVDAPYRAAERVFDAAIKERVDFVVLVGELFVASTSGPRAPVFLADQFDRLARQGIAVYWALAREPESWFDDWPLPRSVVRFPFGRVERYVHRRQGEPVAQILGTSSPRRRKIQPADFQGAEGDSFALAAAHGHLDAQSVAAHPIQFWALGGEHERRTLSGGSSMTHDAGSPQARRPSELGPHGCTLVQVDEAGRARTSFIATDAVRYQREHVDVDEFIDGEQLFQILNDRTAELLGDPFGPELLVQWTVTPNKSLAVPLRRGKLAAELVGRLRAEHASKRPAAWTVGIEVESSAALADDKLNEESLLGEFLRTVRHYVEHPDEPIDLEPYLAERHLAGTLAAAVALAEPAVRQRVLAEAARLGIELLCPQEPA